MARLRVVLRALTAGLALAVFLAFPAPASNDEHAGAQWALARIEAERAWSHGNFGSGATLAVVDTGVNFEHPDLGGAKSAGAVNLIGDNGGDNDCERGTGDNHGHGTAVAGVAAAQANNGLGIASVAPGARILSVKVLDCRGQGTLEDVAEGVRYAARHNARVINLSLGPDLGLAGIAIDLLSGNEFQSAINDAAAAGALVVAAAGNDSLNSYYGGKQNVVVAGATGPDDRIAPYSSSGAHLLAPGGDVQTSQCPPRPDRCILTTGKDRNYVLQSGTSFSAPHVSGVAALLLGQSPGRGPADVRRAMESSADQVAGGPRINAARAVGAPPAVAGGGEQAASASNPAGATAAGNTAAAAAGARGAATTMKSPAGPAPPAAGAEGAPQTLVLPAQPGQPPGVYPETAGAAAGSGRREQARPNGFGQPAERAKSKTLAATAGLALAAAGGAVAWFYLGRRTVTLFGHRIGRPA